MSSRPIAKSIQNVEELKGTNASAVKKRRVYIGKQRKFFILSIPGIIRIFEIVLSCIHVGSYGYFGTFYDGRNIKAVPPFFLLSTRELFFLLTNYSSVLGTLIMIIAGAGSPKSHTALFSSLFPFIFDFAHFLLIISSSIGIILLYLEKSAQDILESSLEIRRGLSVTGIILGCIHLFGGIYDLVIFIRQSESRRRFDV